jgi:hypothetical protein
MNMKKYLLGILFILASALCGQAANMPNCEPNTNIEQVFVIFKTHLDVGFTDLSSKVTERYMTEFIPKALDVADQMRADGSGDRYVWITGAWLIWKYLESADPDSRTRLEEAIKRGDIAWNAVPYTLESEIANRELLEELLIPSKILDERFGKHTFAAKMTDVPGHTRSIITPFVNAGIQFLHVGVNNASAVPAVPSVCRWRNTDGKEILLMVQGDYGGEEILPDGKSVISFNFTGDNHGPHTYDQVKQIYAGIRQRYPKAAVKAVDLNEFADYLLKSKDSFPVVTSEIGDTWIYGYGSAPIRMAKYREMARLFSGWIKSGELEPENRNTINFALELGMIPEHTQGIHVYEYLKNWDKYDVDKFNAARSTEPFQLAEESWKELDDYIDKAIAYLPEKLQKEAYKRLAAIEKPDKIEVPADGNEGDWSMKLLNGKLSINGLVYSMYDANDYHDYISKYSYGKYYNPSFDKPGLDKSSAVSADVKAQIIGSDIDRKRNVIESEYRLAFSHTKIDSRVFPEAVGVKCREYLKKNKVELEVTILNKPAVRLPEAYWLKFNADGLVNVIAEKIGQEVDLSDVVEKGSRWEHAIDRYVDIVTSDGTIRIWSQDAFLVDFGKRPGLNYSTSMPDFHDGLSFNLSNNLWGTNFNMWSEGSLTYHFTIEKL